MTCHLQAAYDSRKSNSPSRCKKSQLLQLLSQCLPRNIHTYSLCTDYVFLVASPLYRFKEHVIVILKLNVETTEVDIEKQLHDATTVIGLMYSFSLMRLFK